MVTHGCNMSCSYCYNGPHYQLSMSTDVGQTAIDRSINSIERGGVLELGFFGGEPLLEAGLIRSLIDYARKNTQQAGLELLLALTTNATVTNHKAWSIVMMPEVDLAVSIDGRPGTHDRHRRFADGLGTSNVVLKTIARLLDAGKEFKAVAVVGPESGRSLAEEIESLRDLGIGRIELSLDLWTSWTAEAIDQLEQAVVSCGRLWAKGLPDISINWFDDKAALLIRKEPVSTCRCGFGKGDIAVTPAGNLYPCERLIEDDRQANPMRLAGNVFQGRDFLFGPAQKIRIAGPCRECAIDTLCRTTCGCCNYVRTGRIGQPDGLLCRFNQWCLRET
jgi:uncharacterized protein